ncbi:MAG TPA: hypothetical protein VK471_07085 [Solirubrobacterales bacterium]|nr:hypothetical protein [Solirubrobacterales bacterium]
MKKRTKVVVAGASALALAAGGAGVAEATGGGAVTETEVGDEESYYQVEVSKTDGSQVDVQLDRGFHAVGQSADKESQDPAP